MPARTSKKTANIIFERSRIDARAVLVDEQLNLRTLDELRRWAARRIPVRVIKSATGEDITRILLA
ncbi:MAG: hypothetical protein JO137_11470 [Hyphomicrobiales bacterium]|nr:hypothetical protein [Hyphomicrobiales bacterium]MBV9432431.1 hypothetical protein [Hyphomicrobiales bacterium]